MQGAQKQGIASHVKVKRKADASGVGAVSCLINSTPNSAMPLHGNGTAIPIPIGKGIADTLLGDARVFTQHTFDRISNLF